MKLQQTVPDSWSDFCDALHKAYSATLPEGQRAPLSVNTLLPLGLVALARTVAPHLVTPEREKEAADLTMRRPGPKKKENLPLFDEKPGEWVSTVRIATGVALVSVGDTRLSLQGCHCLATAATRAVEHGWGAIPEKRGDLPGVRFIPPGAPLAPSVQKPITEADVGALVTREMVLASHLVILPSGRIVKQSDDERAAMISGATKPSGSITAERARRVEPAGDDLKSIDKAIVKTEENARAVLESIAVDALSLGWTIKRVMKGGKFAVRLIPPSVSLTYEVAPGQRLPVDL